MTEYNANGTASTGKIPDDGFGVILQIQLNGQIVVGMGGRGGHFVLSRFNADGSLDPSFGTSGIETGAAEGGGLAMVTAANGETVMIGKVSSGDGIILQEFCTLASHQTLYAEYDSDYNVTSLTNASGGVIERYAYDGYGNVTVLNVNGTVRGDGTAASSFYGWVYLHQGQRLGVGTGLYDDRHRQTYDPALGRFLQEDPAGYVNGTNRYQSFISEPVGSLDPSGLDAASTQPSLPITSFHDPFGGGEPRSNNWQDRLSTQLSGSNCSAATGAQFTTYRYFVPDAQPEYYLSDFSSINSNSTRTSNHRSQMRTVIALVLVLSLANCRQQAVTASRSTLWNDNDGNHTQDVAVFWSHLKADNEPDQQCVQRLAAWFMSHTSDVQAEFI